MQSKTGRMNANHELSVQRTHQLNEFSQDFEVSLSKTHTVELSMHLNLFDILFLFRSIDFRHTTHFFLNFTIQEEANAPMSDAD